MAAIERLEASEYLPKSAPFYVDKRNTFELFEKLQFRANLILTGPAGTGKSLSVAAFCAEKRYPLVTVDCSEDVRRSQLVGMFVLRGNETPFVLGPLPSAIEVANETGCCVLALEELSCLTPQCQKVLNPLTDFRKTLEVPEAKKIFRLDPEAKLWVVGTMNYASYGGVYQVNEDLKSRFRVLVVDYPTAGVERDILENTFRSRGIPFPKKEKGMDTDVVTKLLTLATETRQGKMEYAISTRDLVDILEDVHYLGIDTALKLVAGKFEGPNRQTFTQRVTSIFGITLDAKRR